MSTATATTNPWTVEANSKSGGDGELPPPGVHPAVCLGLIDLGTHDTVYQGKLGERHKLLILWELSAEKKSDGDSFCVHRDFTWSLNEKAELRKFLESWIGRAVQDGEKFDLSSLVKQDCMVNLAAGTSKNGFPYVEVASCSKPIRGLTVPPAMYPTVLFSLSQCTSTKDVPNIPGFIPPLYGRDIVEEIKKSKEWGKLPPF